MKKLFTIFLFSLLPLMASAYVPDGYSIAYDVMINGLYFNLNSNGETKTAEVTYQAIDIYGNTFSDCTGDIIIPESVTYEGITYSVTSIGERAFWNCDRLTSVAIPNSVTSIGDFVFSGNCGISSFTIPDNVTSIGQYALPFTWYENQPDGLVYAGKVLYGYKGTMPEGTSLDIEEGTLGIAGGAFEDCYGLTSVTIPTSVVSIGYGIFSGCRVTSIIVKEGNPYLDSRNNCNAIIETATNSLVAGSYNSVIPYGVKSICNGAFMRSGLMSVEIPNSVTEIGKGAFDSCMLSSVTIPNSVTTIGEEAFSLCGALNSLTIPNSVTSIGKHAFTESGLTSITIPNSVTSIGSYAFSTCGGLTSITIPGSVTSIGDNPFIRCNKLMSIVVEGNNPNYDSRDNCNAIIETKSNKLISGCKNTIVPTGVTAIGDYAFYECDGLTSLTLPDGLTYIGNGAFDCCENLTSVNFPNSVTFIGRLGFGRCYGLTTVTIPSSMTSIGVEAFSGCTNLTSVTIPNSVTSIDSRAFSWTGLTSVTIPNSVTLIDVQAFSNCAKLAFITIGNSVATIYYGAFEGCSSLKDVYCYAKEVPFTVETAFNNSYSSNSDVVNATLHVPASSINAYKATVPWKNFKEIVTLDEEVINITSAQQVPYCSDKNLDFSTLDNLKAYVATGYDKATGTIWLTRVKQVPAETGFLLMGEEGDYEIPVAASAADVYYKNMFKGTLEPTTLQTTDGAYTNYYLSSGEYGVGFYKVNGSVDIKANRAYLQIPTDIPSAGSEGDTEVIKVGNALQVPYYTSKNLDFTTMETKGVKAYTATGYNYGTGTIWLTRVKKVPAKTGVLVMADTAGDYDIPTAEVSSVYENMFVGSETAKTIYTNETIDGVDYVNYYLSNGASGLGFYKVTKEEGVPMAANRCYLPIPKREKASGARGKSSENTPIWYDMILSDEGDDIIAIPLFADGTTSIQSSIFNVQSPDVYYNLQGQRVDNPSKGLYIKNGKKVLIK